MWTDIISYPNLKSAFMYLCMVFNLVFRAVNKLAQEANSSDLAPQEYYHKGFNHMYRLWSYWMSKEPDNYPELFTNNMGEANAIVELIKKVRK